MKRLACMVLALIIPLALIHAHPHMFLTSGAEFVWQNEKLQGVWLEWTFDKFFSADITYAYDANADGKFSAAETQAVHDNAFIYLKNYYYFTFFRQGTARSNPARVEKFSVSQKDGVMSYRFYLDLSAFAPGEFFLAIYDYTFFCDIAPAKNPVKLSYDNTKVKPVYEIVENRNYPVFYDPLAPADDSTIYYQWRKGLQTYYPREIRISYE